MKTLLIVIAVLLIGGGAYYIYSTDGSLSFKPKGQEAAVSMATTTTETATTTATSTPDATKTVIGTSVEGREIVAHHYGTGTTEVLFVGGIHGGYSWNTAVVAQELMKYLQNTPSAVPANVKVTVIPVLNPDGLFKIAGKTDGVTKADIPTTESATIPGRFNAHTVDLNRNFDCDWKESSTWQSRKVSGGTAAFSEPESQAIKGYIEAHRPAGAVVWYSAAGGVYASNCHSGVLKETSELTKTYAAAAGYKASESFDFYAITGDMVNWMAKEGIPAISVLLTSHTEVEWDKNKKGIDAVLKHYAK